MAGNVYLGRVQNVLPSMEAAFVDIGKGRNAVLYAGEVNWDAAGLAGNRAKRIENALKLRRRRPGAGHQGPDRPQGRPADLARSRLPGRYLVYVPDGNMTGISPQAARHRARPPEEDPAGGRPRERRRHRAHGRRGRQRGGAARATSRGCTAAWEDIKAKAASSQTKRPGPAARRARPDRPGDPRRLQRGLRQPGRRGRAGLVARSVGYVSSRGARPRRPGHQVDRRAGPVHRTTGSTSRSPRRMDRKVWLPSGGSLVIDRTEAMTVVDVNTGKFVGSGRQPRGDGHQEQHRGGRGGRPPAPAARHRRHHRHRLHRHGAGEQPRPGRAPPAGVPGP